MTFTVVINSHTYEGRTSLTAGGNKVLHVTGPIEWKRPRKMRGLYNLDFDRWSTRPGRANGGGRYQKEFLQAGRQMIDQVGELMDLPDLVEVLEAGIAAGIVPVPR